jgi:hypothetical protein
MLRPHNPSASSRRRAVILMVVLVLLTLFAIVGLAFVLYANAKGESSRVYRETTIGINRIDIPANSLANYALGQFLFDSPDPVGTGFPAGGWSAMRGHSLGRDLYGWNYDPTDPNAAGTNIHPFNGVGRLHSMTTYPGWASAANDHLMPSYVPFDAYSATNPFIRDPERLSFRTSLTAGPTAAAQPYTGGWNSSYTFPDLNHVFLAAVDGNGNVLLPSFHRPWTTGFGSLAPTNPNWNDTTKPWLKYQVLRPRPVDMGPGFPATVDAGGDVKNLQGYPGGMDSFWMDLDYPVQTAPDGTKFKPLFALLIMDLDGRVNLNVAGNARGAGSAHLSNQGWGPWEVNPAQLSSGGSGSAAEWPQLLVGSPLGAAPTRFGRYGQNQVPATGGSAPLVKPPHYYAQMDYDASNEGPGGTTTTAWTYPFAAWTLFPSFTPGSGYSNGSATELLQHPLLYDSQYPQFPGGNNLRFDAKNLTGLLNGGSSSPTALSTQLGQLLPNNMGAFRIRNLITTDSAAFERPGLTPWIFDRSNATNNYGYTGYAAGTATVLPPIGLPVTFPTIAPALGQRAAAVPASSEFRNPGTGPGSPADWRAVDVTKDSPTLSPALVAGVPLTSALAKIDLNRFLSPYPHQGNGTSRAGYNSTPLLTTNGYALDTPFTVDATTTKVVYNQYLQAVQDRQNLANDIYRRLLLVTGVPPVPAADQASPTDAELAPRRWLAQLAVNIVDYIDEDDISTPFNFYNPTQDKLNSAAPGVGQTNNVGTSPVEANPRYWVFGTEMPKVVLNEVLAECSPTPGGGGPVTVNVFAELFNPIAPPTGTVGTQGEDGNAVPLYNTNAAGGYAIYQVVVADNNIGNGNPGNATIGGTQVANLPGLALGPSATLATPYTNDLVLGTPNMVRAATDFSPTTVNAGHTIQVIGTATTVPPQIGGQSAAPVTNQQFFVVGPPGAPTPDANGTIALKGTGKGVVPTGTPLMTSTTMTYTVTDDGAGNWKTTGATPIPILDNKPTGGINVLLRRTANPHLPPSGATVLPGDPLYNPYITVDYLGGGKPNSVASPPATGAAVTVNVNTGAYGSTVKFQPYAAHPTQIQTTPNTGAAPSTADTFGSVNNPPNTAGAYNWLVHLDRQLISPMELLQVSGYGPYQLTRRFMSPPPGWIDPTTGTSTTTVQKYNHRVDWFSERSPTGTSNRLYRIFEYLTTADRAWGVSPSGRRPGMININTVYDQETFNALCDAQATSSNHFNATQVTTMFNKMLALRHPGGAGPPVTFTGKERPFLGLGIGNTPAADPTVGFLDDGTSTTVAGGIEDTFLRSDGSGTTPAPRLFDVSGSGHPYLAKELMTKIYGNVTNRSNVFAVWMTVGFFQVTDDTVRPVKLGPEIGASTGTNIRHRIFAVVDRTKMNIGTTVPTGGTAVGVTWLNGAVTVPTPGVPTTASVLVAAGSNTTTPGGTATPIPWQIAPGSVLNIDQGTQNEETVVVQSVTPFPPTAPNTPATITAQFMKSHLSGVAVNIPGNPGPQPSFSITAPGFSGLLLTNPPAVLE